MPPMPQSYSMLWTSGDGDDGGGGGGFPRTLESGRSPGPTCPGTKYPVRGIPHFDELFSSVLDYCKTMQQHFAWSELIQYNTLSYCG